MPILKKNNRFKIEPVIKTKVNVKLSVENAKKQQELRKQNIERQKKLIQEIKKLSTTILSISVNKNISVFIIKKNIFYSKILAKEILITETFINRLRRETNRPIVVIGNGGTGKPYTWGIKKKSGIYIRNINYPSTRSNLDDKIITKLNYLIKNTKIKLKNPLFVFVDASKSPRMPSALTGYENPMYTQQKESIHGILSKKNNIKTIGYDWSMNDGRRYLPKISNDLKTDIILFNPVGKGKEPENYAAHHDDKDTMTRNPLFRELTKKRVELLKLQWFGE